MQPKPPAGVAGTFVYRNYRGQERRLDVRECPNPAQARLALERDVVEGPVRWEPRR